MNKLNMKYLQKMKIKYTNKFFNSKIKNEKMIHWEWEGGWSVQEVSSVSGTLRRCSGALLWE